MPAKLLNTSQAAIILRCSVGMTKETFAKRYNLNVAAQQGNGNHSTWFYDENEVIARAKEREAKENARETHIEELVNHPAAIAKRFVSSDLIERMDRIEMKLDRAQEKLNKLVDTLS